MADTFSFQITLEGDDPEYVLEQTQQLSDNLRELDMVEDVQPAEGALPEGAKGLALTFGALVATVAKSGALTSLASTITAWLAVDRSRKLKVTINGNTFEINNATQDQQQKLVDAFISASAKTA